MALCPTDDVRRYKKRLEREPDENTVLSVIHKLSKIKITVEILQDTGIGKVIRTLAKQPGKIGEKAKAVLQHWREVVACSQKSQENVPKHEKSSKKENVNKNSSHDKHVSSKLAVKNLNGNHLKQSHHAEHKRKSNESSKENTFKTVKNGDYTETDPSPYTYRKAQSEANYIDYDPHSDDINLGYNPDHPELYPGSNKVSKKVSKGLDEKAPVYESSKGNASNGKRKSSLLDDDISHKSKKVKIEDYKPTVAMNGVKDKNKVEKHKVHSHQKDKIKDKKTSSSKGEKEVSSRKSESFLSDSGTSKKTSDSKKLNKNKETGDKKSSSSKKNKMKLKIQTKEEFTSSEVSFEDCLGLNDIVAMKKKKPVKSTSSIGNKKIEKRTAETSVKNSQHPIREKSTKKHSAGSSESSPEHSNKRNEVDIVSTLSQPQPNYRPLPQRSYEACNIDAYGNKKKVLSNEDAIKFTSSRREKTAVYSGRKNCHYTEVPTLFEFCTRVLIDNIDAIEYMGEVPYFLLKQVLERCNPVQLYQIEHYNPYLLEDTHELWKSHCKRDYRTSVPQENETWRDLYWRASEEREKKLKSITAHISASMSKSNPVRQVKLAYVDSVVKPPRDVARRQAKNGTGLPVNHTVKPGPSGKTPRPIAPVINTASSSSSSSHVAPKKPKVAPLMAKTLKSLKLCYRR